MIDKAIIYSTEKNKRLMIRIGFGVNGGGANGSGIV